VAVKSDFGHQHSDGSAGGWSSVPHTRHRYG
jgi:hypothetical protein